MLLMLSVLALALPSATNAGIPMVAPAPAERGRAARLPIYVGGRVVASAGPDGPAYRRQWPGTYFETAFRGTAADFRVGEGKVILKVSVDGTPVSRLVDPRPGAYRVSGLGAGAHRLRVDVVAENQDGPTVFGGFFAPAATRPLPIRARPRQIEFIGDSHTVGYGNTSPNIDCTQEEVRLSTDTSRGVAARVAGRYDADYQVNAISGRGVVRNYSGFAAAKLPEAYPFALPDGPQPATTAGWHPQVIVVALGTNDFTTDLHAGEKWQDRAALHTDFEQTYAGFLQRIRRANPQAFVIVWATDMAGGEIEAEAGRVVARLRTSGEARIAFVPMHGLALAGCHAHPTVADDAAIADAIGTVIDAHPGAWPLHDRRTGS